MSSRKGRESDEQKERSFEAIGTSAAAWMRGNWGGRGVFAILVGSLGIVGQCIFWNLARHHDNSIARENGPMENFQAGCIFMGLLCLLGGVRNSRVPGSRCVFGGTALLYFTMLLVEIDFRKIAPKALMVFLKGSSRNVLLAVLWIGTAWVSIRQADSVFRFFRQWLKSPSGVMILLAGLLWVLGGFFDKGLFKTGDYFAEELIESNAAFLMLLAGCMIFADSCEGLRRRPEGDVAPLPSQEL